MTEGERSRRSGMKWLAFALAGSLFGAAWTGSAGHDLMRALFLILALVAGTGLGYAILMGRIE